MSVFDFDSLRAHFSHEIQCVVYGQVGVDERNVAIECLTCNEVLLDFDKNELPGHDESTIQHGDKYFFNIQIAGTAKTRQEAWEAAIEAFIEDPGQPPDEPEMKRGGNATAQPGGTPDSPGDPPQPGNQVPGSPL